MKLRTGFPDLLFCLAAMAVAAAIILSVSSPITHVPLAANTCTNPFQHTNVDISDKDNGTVRNVCLGDSIDTRISFNQGGSQVPASLAYTYDPVLQAGTIGVFPCLGGLGGSSCGPQFGQGQWIVNGVGTVLLHYTGSNGGDDTVTIQAYAPVTSPGRPYVDINSHPLDVGDNYTRVSLTVGQSLPIDDTGGPAAGIGGGEGRIDGLAYHDPVIQIAPDYSRTLNPSQFSTDVKNLNWGFQCDRVTAIGPGTSYVRFNTWLGTHYSPWVLVEIDVTNPAPDAIQSSLPPTPAPPDWATPGHVGDTFTVNGDLAQFSVTLARIVDPGVAIAAAPPPGYTVVPPERLVSLGFSIRNMGTSVFRLWSPTQESLPYYLALVREKSGEPMAIEGMTGVGFQFAGGPLIGPTQTVDLPPGQTIEATEVVDIPRANAGGPGVIDYAWFPIDNAFSGKPIGRGIKWLVM